MLLENYDLKELPSSLHNAFITVFPKLGKPPRKCESYQPISLINSAAKIIAKLLERDLSGTFIFLLTPTRTGVGKHNMVFAEY